MRRLLFLVAVLLVTATAAEASERARTSDSAAGAREPVLATRDSGSGSRLFYVNPVSLRPLPRRSLWLDFHWGDFVRAPDRSLIALSRNDAPGLRFVRLGGLRFAGAMTFAEGHFVRPVAWPSPHLLLALLDSSPEQVLAIDPGTRKVLWRRSIGGSVVEVERFPAGVVVLAAPAKRIGPARVTVIRADSSVRSVVLDRVLAGFHGKQGSQDFVGKMRTPGLAIDPVAKHAYVVGAGEPVAQIHLASMRVSYHGSSRTLAKAVSGPRRQATWLGNRMLAVAGTNSSIRGDSQGNVQQTVTPSGLVLIDRRTWTSRMLQSDADATITVGGWLLAYSSSYVSASKARTGSGLTVYGLDGTPRRHPLGRTPISEVQAQGGLAYVWLADKDRRVDVLDPASGRILASVTMATGTVLLARS